MATTFNGPIAGNVVVKGNIHDEKKVEGGITINQTSSDSIENNLNEFIKALSELKTTISDKQAVNEVNELEEEFVNGVKNKKSKNILTNTWDGIKRILEKVTKNSSGIAALGTLVAKILKWI